MRMQNTFYALAIAILLSITGCAKHETTFPSMGTNCDQNPVPDQKALDYLEHPDAIDTTCSGGLLRAEKDFADGKLAFSLEGWGHRKRYQEELEKLCTAKGLILHSFNFGCLRYTGQTLGCYEGFMDKKIMERYGKDFKCQLINKADSIFLAKTIINDDAVYSYYCDTGPILPNEFYGNSYWVLFKNGEPFELKKKEDYAEVPNFQMKIVIGKNGTISRLSKSDREKLPYAPPNYFWLKDEVVEQVFDFIKKEYPVWKPGQIKGVPVRTIFNMNIYLGGS